MARIDLLLDRARARGATELLVASARPPVARVRGELVALGDGALSPKEVLDLTDELLTPPLRARLAAESSVAFAHEQANGESARRVRVRIVQAQGGLAASLRLLPSRAPTLEELGAPDAVRALADLPSGLVVVAGGSASANAATLAAMLEHVNRTRPVHVATIEDPIEIVFTASRAQVTQREVGVHVPSIVTGLSGAARDDCEVVLVSALPSAEAVASAVSLAGSGVAVLAALSTRGVPATMSRLLSAFRDDALLGETLAGIVAVDAEGGGLGYEVVAGAGSIADAVARAAAPA